MTFKEIAIVESLDSVIKQHQKELLSDTKAIEDLTTRADIVDSLKLFKKFVNTKVKDYTGKKGGTSLLTREFNTVQTMLEKIERDLHRIISKVGKIPALINLYHVYVSMVDKVDSYYVDMKREYADHVATYSGI